MKNPLEARKRVMGYSEAARADRACSACKHVRRQGADLRCPAGGFFVRETASCIQFEAARKVAIGPTDI